MLKDKKIRIQQQITTGQGAHETTAWVDLGNTAATDPPHYLWAYFRHMSQKELSISTVEAYEAQVMFTINWRADVLAGQRVVYGGVNYEIINVDNFEGNKTDLKIYARAAV